MPESHEWQSLGECGKFANSAASAVYPAPVDPTSARGPDCECLTLRTLDLFAGIGGFSLGLERAGMRTVAFCENHPRRREHLARRWPEVPCHDDIRTLHPARGSADVVCGGFPCQPHSTASRGRRVATDLWGEMLRVVGECAPRYVIAENVLGLGLAGVDRVCGDLEASGYTVWPYRVDTAPPGRQRARDRFIFVAHANGERKPRRPLDAQMARLCGLSVSGLSDVPAPVGVDDGLPGRMDRLGGLGNALVPQIAEVVGRAIILSEAS